jgi:hypothetical protein
MKFCQFLVASMFGFVSLGGLPALAGEPSNGRNSHEEAALQSAFAA